MLISALFSSCSDIDTVEADYSFSAAKNVNIDEFSTVQFETFDDLNLGFLEVIYG